MYQGVLFLVVFRRQVEQLEADHCLAEARRMSQLAAQQTNIEQLKETGDKLKRLSSSVSHPEKSGTFPCIFTYPANFAKITIATSNAGVEAHIVIHIHLA